MSAARNRGCANSGKISGKISGEEPRSLPDTWRAKAAELERFAPAAAEAFRECAETLEASTTIEVVTLAEAERLGGYSIDHLSRLVRDGTIENMGRRGAPRIRRVDVPVKAGHCLPMPPTADQLTARRRIVADAQAHRGA